MNARNWAWFFWLTLVICQMGGASALEVKSPDGRVALTFEVKDSDGAKSCAVYSVRYGDATIVVESRLGVEIKNAPLRDGLQILRHTENNADAQWKPVYGERSMVRDNYHQVVVELQEREAPRRLLALTFRAYNEGAAFCYTLPAQPGLDRVVIVRESTEFRFAADHFAWATYSAQGRYEKVPLSRIRRGCERPLVIRVADNAYAAVAEARLVDYARMKLAPLRDAPHSLAADLGSSVVATLPLRTPWRVVMLAESPARLLENNDLMLNLNDPCAFADASWIKPGKVIREVTLSTAGGKACVDFAVKHNLQYVEYDAGWYGEEGSEKSDARAANVDPKRSRGTLDLPEVIRYARDRGIGVILYVNRRALERQLDDILPLYQSWGVAGVKYGFVNVGSQRWTAWLHEAVRKAADHRLMVDIHDEYRPTGYSRTYPNLMTQEGIAGDEARPPASQTLTILFTRYLAGPADNTICYFDPRVDELWSHAFQLAKAVCLYSPWQFLYWYDRPGIGDEPELEFFDQVPTVWDDTRVLDGQIGDYAVIARRSGDTWFVGCLNADTPRALTVPLSFLDANKKFTAHIYSDDPNVPTRTRVKIERFAVDRATVLRASLAARSGQAVRIVPATARLEDARDSQKRNAGGPPVP